MDISLIAGWVLAVSALTALGAWYARRWKRADALIALYVTFVVFANIAASKIVTFDLGFTRIYAPAVVLVFAVTFLITDIVNERFGRAETQRMIAIALVAQLGLVAFSAMVISAKSAPFFSGQAAFETLFGSVPRIIAASLLAFFVSENADAYLFERIRKMTGDRHLWMRNVFSSVPAMVLDSTIFVTVAFAGVQPLLPLIIGLTTMKWIVSVIDIPFMYLARAIMHGGEELCPSAKIP